MGEITRRQAIGRAVAATVAAPFINRNAYALGAGGKTYSKRTVDLVRRSVVIDMLAPLKIEVTPDFYTKPLSAKDADEFLSSGITGFHHSFGSGGPQAHEQALEYFAIWGNYLARNGHVFVGVDKVADIVRAKREGKCAIILGLQNADHFLKPADVKDFFEIGQRCAQLTYNSQNRIGSGSTDRVDGGVSDFGATIVKAMNDVGMLVDVSHSGDRTTLDAIALSSKPIAITHSNCRALVNHPRVKTDEAIRALAAKGGVMGISGVRQFVKETEPTTLGSMVEHIDHVVKLVGVEHVGIGSDSDLNGYDDTSPAMQKALRAAYKDSYAFRDMVDIEGFNHPRKMFDLTEELIRRNYSDGNIAAILGGNFQRLLTTIWGG